MQCTCEFQHKQKLGKHFNYKHNEQQTNKQTSPSNASSELSHLAKAAFAKNLDKVKVLETPPLALSVLSGRRGVGRRGRGGGGGGGRGGGVLGSLLVERECVLQAI